MIALFVYYSQLIESGMIVPVISRTAVTLRFTGDELQPEEISNLLGCKPDMSAPRNGTWRTPQGVERTSKTGMWHKRIANRSPGDLDGQVVELLALMTDDLETWQQVTLRFSAYLFCSLFLDETNEGIELEASTLLALGARGIKLGLDIYASETEPLPISQR